MEERECKEFIAYELYPQESFDIIPAPLKRNWIEAAGAQGINRCLPLVAANQAGWWIVTNRGVRASWNGGPAAKSIQIETLGESFAASHFGNGVLTFSLPWLFATPPGWSLLARGPANHVKDGIQALEGLVETDWAYQTFTLNWIFTRPGSITFTAGEPIGMLVPQRQGDLEGFAPILLPLSASGARGEAYARWRESRSQFLSELAEPGSDAQRESWQKDYMRQAVKKSGPVRLADWKRGVSDE
jgi:Family of unknown function (DUF6065)